MTGSTTSMPTSPTGTRSFLEPAIVARLLRDRLPLDWPNVGNPREVRIERYWPAGASGLAFEWSFRVAAGGRHSLFAVPDTNGRPDDAADPEDSGPPRITSEGVRGLRVHLAEQDLTVHSSDRDPAMPHLAACLDAKTAARRIGVLGDQSTQRSEAAGCRVEAELLGYRARRRAAIRYRVCGPGASERTVLGKTFRDERGARLFDVHAQLHEQIRIGSGGRVAVPASLGYDRPLRMAFLTWAPGRKLDDASVALTDCARAAVRALICLHRTNLDRAPQFTPDDECEVIRRWHRVLTLIDPEKAEATASLVAALLAWGETIEHAHTCTVHRDFYERQLVRTPNTVTILDLDTVAQGHPGVDLGNFLAHLLLRVRRRDARGTGFAPCAALFVRRYEARAGAVDRGTLGFYLSSALFRLGAVHAFRTATGRFAETLWKLAAKQLAQGSFAAAQWDSSRPRLGGSRTVPTRSPEV